jgi:hypothetical protein
MFKQMKTSVVEPDPRIRNPDLRIREANYLLFPTNQDTDPNWKFCGPLKKYVVKKIWWHIMKYFKILNFC